MMPKQYKILNGYFVTYNARERTYSIYSQRGEFLSTVNDGELNAELNRLDRGED